MLNTKLSLLLDFYSVLLSELGSRNFVIGSNATLVTRAVVIVNVVTQRKIRCHPRMQNFAVGMHLLM